MPFERGGTHEDHNTKGNAISFQSNNLELRLGISSSDSSCSNNMACSKAMNSAAKGFSCSTSASNIAPAALYRSSSSGSSSSVLGLGGGGGGSYVGFPQSPLGFVHPWSLAARQQKAAIEQAHHQKPTHLASASPSAVVASSSLSRAAQLPPLAAVVGWPPVREFRRNLVSTNLPKSAMDDREKGATRATPAAENINDDDDNDNDSNNMMKRRTESRPTMFVKVNMEGYVVGRKINLRAHDSYESLSRAVQKMFSNFLSTTYFNNSGEEESDDAADPDFILLYEDHEGDRMLVGDVPWKLFITSVKRLYIAHNPKMQENGNGSVADDDDQHMKKQLNEADK